MQNNWRPLLVLSLFLGLAIYFQAFLMTNIFEPIAVLFWALWRIIASVHQNYFWMILILISSMLLIRFIPFTRNTSGSAYPDERSSPNRVEDWLRLMKNASDGTEETEFLRDSLKRLLISIYQVEQPHYMKMDEGVMPEAALLPEIVHRFLFPTKRKHNCRSQILLFIPKWIRNWASKVFQIDNPPIEETLEWMESVMEINNDQ
ncbi:MAG TPA: hypothetical protein VK206_11985 [Anaerolineales bacterium]|nr:hypothetical protein [Anaerolineales bacterium]